MTNHELLNRTKDSLKKSLYRAEWWGFVQPEVKQKIEVVTDNVDKLGMLFKQNFLALFAFSHTSRIISKENYPPARPGALFDAGMTEECYQSGIMPTKVLLNLNDWTLPNDADVQSCLYLCQQIEAIDSIKDTGILEQIDFSQTTFIDNIRLILKNK